MGIVFLQRLQCHHVRSSLFTTAGVTSASSQLYLQCKVALSPKLYFVAVGIGFIVDSRLVLQYRRPFIVTYQGRFQIQSTITDQKAILTTFPALQIHAFYLHRVTLTWSNDLAVPEQFGFAHRQVSSFFIDTKENKQLHAWHVVPIGAYHRNLDVILHG